ncbi:MAG TPA: transposase [Terriglobales bacterium]|nr:transposase [Terriglobales bacterium]
MFHSRPAIHDNPAMSFYRRNLPHLQKDSKPHFLTFCTKHRWILPDFARDVVLDACCHWHGKRYTLYVVVVMPDHVHMIVTPLIDCQRMRTFPLSQITHTIKSFSAHEINRQLGRVGAVWQDESFDHVVRSSEGLDAKIGYVLANPVRQGLVKAAAGYRWIWQKPVEYWPAMPKPGA